jgi:hypothetical protein
LVPINDLIGRERTGMGTPDDVPERGDLVQVSWVDIYEDPTGDPDSAKLKGPRVSYGLYWGTREDRGIPCVVTTTTLDNGDQSQQGFCIYPTAVVLSLKVVKRTRKRKKNAGIPA